MTSIRKLLGLFATIALMAFALPAAADKAFQQQMTSSPSPLAPGGSGLVSMQLNNIASDAGNSNVGSFKLNAPTGFTITSVYGVGIGATQNSVAIGGGYTATIKNNGGSVWVSSIQVPLKPFGPVLVLSNMQVSLTCSADTTGTWVMAGVWNGQNFSGQTFVLNSPAYAQYHSAYPSVVTTPASGAAGTIGFVTNPADAFPGSNVTTVPFNSAGAKVQVQLAKCGGGAPPSTAVTVGSDCAVSGSAPNTDVNGYSSLTLTSTGTSAQSACHITASAAGFGSATSSAFNIVANAGILGCDSSNNRAGNLSIDPTGDIVYTGTPDWSLIRASTPGCTPIPYTFDFDPTNKKFSFIADKGNPAQPLLVEYIVLWNPETPTAADGYPTDYHLLLAWGFGVFPPANYFTPSVPCKQDVLAFSSLPTIPPVEPFITLSGQGLTQYTPNTTAAMCQAAHGWGAVGPLSGPQVQHVDKVIDTDGFGRLP